MSASSSRASHFLASPPPAAAVAIDGRRVTGVSVSGHGTSLIVSGHASQALPPGAVTPALNAVNVHDPAALAAAVTAVLDALSPRPRRVALVLPDAVGKVSLVRFEKVPARTQDLDQLIRWQVRKAAPYRVEDAQVAWSPGTDLTGGGREFIVTTARRDVIESYEQACAAAGAHAGLVDLATLNLVNAALAVQGHNSPGDPSTLRGAAGSGQDWLLVHVTEDDTALAVVRGATLIFYRHRDASAGEDLAGLVHQTAMYHEDRLGGGGFSRVFLAGASSRGAEQAAQLRRELEAHAGVRAEPLDFRGAVTLRDRIVASPELLDSLGAPLGTLLREQVA
jgi:Tfp pilus assembly PilM family ATPase